MNEVQNNTVKKRILLLTYYFYPCNYVASNRPNSFTKELVKNNFEVIVITRHWTGKEQVWVDYLKNNDTPVSIEKKENLTIHRLPYIQPPLPNNKFFSKLKVLWHLSTGNINPDLNYYQFKPYIETLLKNEPIDFIMVSIPPLNILRLGHELSKKYSKKLFIDVRDYENNIVLNKSLKVKFSDKIKHRFALYHSMKWFKMAWLLFTVTPEITNFIRKHSGANTITIMNGYEKRLLNITEKEYTDFHITFMGTLYEIPEFNELLIAFKSLFQKNFASEIKVQFIGTGILPSVVSKIKDVIPSKNLVLLDRMAQKEAQLEVAKSQLLLVVGFKSMKGILGTKLFEYLGLRKTIILMPGDRDLMEKTILDCNAGYCPSTTEEFVNIVDKSFHEWKEKGYLKYNGNIENIKKYSREEQFEKLLPYFIE